MGFFSEIAGGIAEVSTNTNLESKSFIKVVDLVSEGEIEGLVDGAKSIYLNDTRVQNDDGTLNFEGIVYETRSGLNTQPAIKNFSDIENERNVSLEVRNDNSIIQTVTNQDVNAVRVRVRIPALFRQKDDGGTAGLTVTLACDVQSNGGTYIPQAIGRAWVNTAITQTGTNSFQMTQDGYGFRGYINATPVSYDENGTPSYSTGQVKLQYKLTTSPTWIDGATIDVQPSSGFSIGNIFASLFRIFGRSAESEWGFQTQDLPLGRYDFRFVTVSGSPVYSVTGVQRNAGSTELNITGKSTSVYETDFIVLLSGQAPWNIRLRRVTGDTTDIKVQNKTFWQSFTEIISSKLRYPNSALVALQFDSKSFQGTPTRGYDMKLLKVKVPSNYDPVNRIYTGVWDGTFVKKWTDNPAWCFYDLLTNERYGLGGLIDQQFIDKWTLYSVGRYCDELVPDGKGGFEPRFTCNLYLQSRQEAYKVIQDMASIFRAMVYWQSGTLTVSQDAPADPVALFTPANVQDGNFSYTGSSAKARHTVALVTWNDPEDLYRQKVEYVEDTAGIQRYGVIETEVVAIGCTSRGQANRVGRWLLYTEQSEAETVFFKTGIEGSTIRPGHIIEIADPVRAGSRRGGRIRSATTSSVTLDAPISLTGSGHTLSVVLPDGSVQERAIASVSGSTVLVASPFGSAPAPESIYVVQSPNLQAQTYRVISAIESEDGIEINALAHNPSKFDAIENGLELQARQISELTLTPNAPENVVVTESLYESAAEVKTLVLVSWSPVVGATSYQVSYKLGDGNFINVPETASNSVEIRDVEDGDYTFRVVAINPVGKRSSAAEKQQTILAQAAPPANVQNFSVIPVAGMAYLSWDKSVDLDVLVGGTVRIRWTPKTIEQDWNDAVDILPAMSGNQRNAQAPLLAGTYMAKFVDALGNPSRQAALVVTTIADSINYNVVETITEHPTFAGTKTNCVVNGLTGELEIVTVGGEVQPSATYLFGNSVDLGATYTSRLSAYIEARGFSTSDLIDSRLDLIDSWEDFDGASIETVTGLLYVRSTNDNPAGSPTWTEWKPFFVGEYTARAYQFKLELTSDKYDHNIGIKTLTVTVDMPDRVQAIRNIVSGTSTYTVTYPEPFHATPTIGVTANNMASGDYYTITNSTRTGFDIIFRNSAGTAVSRTFDVMAKGYGKAT